ncbi:MAG TPA: hypothetical protein VJU82_09965 [Acidobacteriaceae bacterium]|nr:hypothetical protein [Acidobacteriaceae bacterium]
MHPPLPSRLGKVTQRKGIDGSPLIYEVEDEEVFVAPSNAGKAFSLQKLRFSDGRIEFRICYYMIAHKPRMKGKWAFGQFAPMMTPQELEMIMDIVCQKGWVSSDVARSDLGLRPPAILS